MVEVDPRSGVRDAAMRRVTGSNADRGGHIGQFHTASEVTRVRAPVTGYIVLGTDVVGVGFNLLEPRLELGSRVVGEGFG